MPIDSRAFALTSVRHLLCVLALMWTGLVNGQAFFFQSDTTNYIRSADVAVYLASGKTFRTAWTDRYSSQLDTPADHRQGPQAAQQNEQRRVQSANDLRSGLIMGGRSPYIGALMYLGYVLGDFWPFLLFQAATAYVLIIFTLRAFDVASVRNVVGTTMFVALFTALPSYNSMLLADAFTGFGILAFLLLLSHRKYTRAELAFLLMALFVFAVSHLTHLMILAAMLALLGAMAALKFVSPVPKRAWIAGIGAILAGVASIQATSLVTEQVFGRKPQLLPLLSARFIADGPGAAYIDAGCDGRRYQICRIPIGAPESDALILFGTTRESGAYMLASADERRRMGEEDISFALSVLRFDPAGQVARILRNTFEQLTLIEYRGLNQNCFHVSDCWQSLPEPIREELKQTPSGRGLWPEKQMTVLLQVTVILSILAIAAARTPMVRDNPDAWRLMRTWLLLLGGAMLVNSFFGGAVAEPQYRYQTRLFWLVPLFAAVSVLAYLRLSRASAARESATAAS